jgi:glycosyltransferase involved in cell wall biosynthesis
LNITVRSCATFYGTVDRGCTVAARNALIAAFLMKKGYSGGKQVDDLITVIIPVYNVETYLRKCIDSVVNQTYKNLQIIIVDDGSTDLSGAICDEYAKKDNRIVVMHKDNGGLSSARNAGMEIAKGQYISFVDSDDWIELTFYEEMMDFIDKYSVDIVMCGAKVIKDSAYIEDRFIYFKNDCVIEHDAALEMILKDEIGSQVWCKLSKTKLWDNIKFPEKRLFEDIPAVYKTFARCTTDIGFIAKPMYYYVLHGDSISFKKIL